ncbi:hypothetical protein [Daejeonella sp.]|uniref:hypothetical protein n=1 Tax=Daejeonella sp. TaxID=2805397 RepID=UPI0025C2456D|nr:hypothetical protein [Daejeonella sp.]
MSSLHSNEFNTLSLLLTEDIYVLDKMTVNQIDKSEENVKVPITEQAIQVEKPTPTAIPTLEPIQTSAAVPEIKKSPEFTYIGENNKYFLILIDDANNKEISPIHKETLLKIMTAKGLELRDLAVLNLNLFPNASVNELKEFFSCSKLVLFGINPQRISLPSISSNKVENHLNIKLFSTYSIDEMINDVNKKKEFWAIMKDF